MDTVQRCGLLHLMNVGKFESGVTLGEHALKDFAAQTIFMYAVRALMGWTLCMQALGRGEEAVRYLLEEKDAHPAGECLHAGNPSVIRLFLCDEWED